MYYKVKSTLVGLAVAVFSLGVSYSIGQPPMHRTVEVDYAAPGVEAQVDELQALRRYNRGMKSQLSMPFYSFAPLLPRRES